MAEISEVKLSIDGKLTTEYSSGVAKITNLTIPQGAGAIGSNKRIAWAFGNSITVGGAVYGTGENHPQLYTSLDLWGWVNAALGRTWKQVIRHGKNGATSAGILSNLKTKLNSSTTIPDDILLFGLCHNDVANSLTADQTVANIKAMITQSQNANIIVAVDTMWDAGQTGLGRTTYKATVDAVLELALQCPNVIVLPIHTSINSKTPGATTSSRSVTIDGIHPSAVGIVQCIVPNAISVLSKVRSALGVPLIDGDDFNAVTHNPFVGGSNSSGSGEFYAQGGATGSGPGGFLCKIESGTMTVTSSKVQHPKQKGWGHGEASAACWKVSMQNTGGTNSEVTIAGLDVSVVAWSSGLSLVTPRQIVKPTVANGCLYKVVDTGSLATGADPTATWSTVLGTEFTNGTTTLRCVQDWRGKNVQLFLEMYPDQTTMSGKFALQLFGFGNTTAAPFTALPGYGGWCYGLTQAIGATAEFGTDGGLSWLPDYLLASTPYVTETPVDPAVENYSFNLKVRLAASSRLDLTISAFGAAVAV